jgi:NAD-dependent dihydropyrimidine dehydrogenase PreA subunit
MPKINGRVCIGCGACVHICPADVYRMSENKMPFIAYPEDCISVRGCWLCIRSCPVEAISWKDHFDKFRKEFSPAYAWEERKRAWGLIEDKT